MTIKRLELSNPDFTPKSTQYYTIHSSYLMGRSDVSVYNSHTKGRDLPIIVLMHGVYGSHWVWMHLGGVHHVYDHLRSKGIGKFVLVMPSDGGYKDGSAYLPLENSNNYDAWIMEDVLEAVIDNTPCLSQQSKIYLSGLSMGGYGALRLGMKYAQRVSGISAHSSVTNLDDLSQFIHNSIGDYHCVEKFEQNIHYWAKKNRDKLPPLRMDCGEEDTLINSNITLSEKLTSLSIPHTFEQYPGAHSWEYWNKHVATTIKFFNDIHYL